MGNGNPPFVMWALLSSLSRHGIVYVVALAACIHVPDRLDRLLANIAVLVVILYRKSLSPWLGKQCLFHPSCSQRALHVLRECGWNRGIVATQAQLRRCCGNFLIRVDEGGALELETVDGLIVSQDELSDFVVEKFGSAGVPFHVR